MFGPVTQNVKAERTAHGGDLRRRLDPAESIAESQGASAFHVDLHVRGNVWERDRTPDRGAKPHRWEGAGPQTAWGGLVPGVECEL